MHPQRTTEWPYGPDEVHYLHSGPKIGTSRGSLSVEHSGLPRPAPNRRSTEAIDIITVYPTGLKRLEYTMGAFVMQFHEINWEIAIGHT